MTSNSFYATQRALNSPEAVKKSREALRAAARKVDIKACTGFAKKLENLTEEMLATMVVDVSERLNLGKFIEEIVPALLKSPVKMKEVPAVVLVCGALHRHYEDFAAPLVKGLETEYETLFSPKLTTQSEDGGASLLPRKRILLRWLSELYFTGVLQDGGQVIVKCLRLATRQGLPPGPPPPLEPLGGESAPDVEYKEADEIAPLPNSALNNLVSVVLFAKNYGKEMGLGVSTEELFPPELVRTRLVHLLRIYRIGLKNRLRLESESIIKLDLKTREEMNRRGEVDSATTEALKRKCQAYGEMVEQYEALLISVEGVSPHANPHSTPSMMAMSLEEVQKTAEARAKEEEERRLEATRGETLGLWTKEAGDFDLSSGSSDLVSMQRFVFGNDEEQRSFYCDLVDLTDMFPRSMFIRGDGGVGLQPWVLNKFKSSPESNSVDADGKPLPATEGDAQSPRDAERGLSEAEIEALLSSLEHKKTGSSIHNNFLTGGEEPEDEQEDYDDFDEEFDYDEDGSAIARTTISTDGRKRNKPQGNTPMDVLLTRLKDLTSDRAVVEFAMDFVPLHSAVSKRRLIRELIRVPMNRPDVIPYYAKLASTLGCVFIGILPELTKSLRTALLISLRDVAAQKDANPRRRRGRIEAKCNKAKLLGELIKFGLFPPARLVDEQQKEDGGESGREPPPLTNETTNPTIFPLPGLLIRTLNQIVSNESVFRKENVEVFAALLESAGFELVRHAPTRPEALRTLEMTRKMRNTCLSADPFLATLVDNAVFHCLPREVGSVKRTPRRARSEEENFLRWVLFEHLPKTVEEARNEQASRVPLNSTNSKERGRTPSITPGERRVDSVGDTVARLLLAPTNPAATSPHPSINPFHEALTHILLALHKRPPQTVSLVVRALVKASKSVPSLPQRVADVLVEGIRRDAEEEEEEDEGVDSTISLGTKKIGVKGQRQRCVARLRTWGECARGGLISLDTFYDVLFSVLLRDERRKSLARRGGDGDVSSNDAAAAQRSFNDEAVNFFISASVAHTFDLRQSEVEERGDDKSRSSDVDDGFKLRLVCAALESAGGEVLTHSLLAAKRLNHLITYMEWCALNRPYFAAQTDLYFTDVVEDVARAAATSFKEAKKSDAKKKNSKRGNSEKEERASLPVFTRFSSKKACERMIETFESSAATLANADGALTKTRVRHTPQISTLDFLFTQSLNYKLGKGTVGTRGKGSVTQYRGQSRGGGGLATLDEGEEEEEEEEEDVEEEESESDEEEGEEEEEEDDGATDATGSDERLRETEHKEAAEAAERERQEEEEEKRKRKRMEDKEFDEMFARMMSLEGGGPTSLPVGTAGSTSLRLGTISNNLAIPMGMLKNLTVSTFTASSSDDELAAVNLLKKNAKGKAEMRKIYLPKDEEIARAAGVDAASASLQRREREDAKRLVLRSAAATGGG